MKDPSHVSGPSANFNSPETAIAEYSVVKNKLRIERKRSAGKHKDVSGQFPVENSRSISRAGDKPGPGNLREPREYV